MNLLDRCLKIDWLILDVDGVLTPGDINYADDETELKRFNVRDGTALKVWEFCEKHMAIITGRRSKSVEVRGNELGAARIIQGQIRKKPALEAMMEDFGFKPEQACYVGDDIADLSVLRHCGLAVAVADAIPDVKRAAHFVTRANGGQAAVRETVEQILRAQGRWQEFLKEFV